MGEMAQQAMADMTQLVVRIQGVLADTTKQLTEVTVAYRQLQGRYAALQHENGLLRAQLVAAAPAQSCYAGVPPPVYAAAPPLVYAAAPPPVYAAAPGPSAQPGGRPLSSPRDEEILSLRRSVADASNELMEFECVTGAGGVEQRVDPVLDSTRVLDDKDQEICRLQMALGNKQEALREWQEPNNEDALLDLEITRLQLLLQGVSEALSQYESVSKLEGSAATGDAYRGRPMDTSTFAGDKSQEVARLREAIVARTTALQQWQAETDNEEGNKDLEIARLRLLLTGIADALAQYERVSKIDGDEQWEDFDLDSSRVLRDKDKEIDRLRQAIDRKTSALRDWQAHLSVDHWNEAEIERLRQVLAQRCLELGQYERVSKNCGPEDSAVDPALDSARVLSDKDAELTRLQREIEAKESALREWRDG